MTISPHPHMIRNILPLSCASSPPWRSPRLSWQRKSSYSFLQLLVKVTRPGCKVQDFWKILEAGFLEEQERIGGNRERSRELLVAALGPSTLLLWPQHCTRPFSHQVSRVGNVFLHSSETSFVSSEINHATLCHSVYQVWPRHIIP